MPDIRPFDLGSVLGTAEQIKGMRQTSVTESLRQQLMGQQMQAGAQAMTLAQNQDARAAAAESRQAAQFSAEQQVQNTRLLNVAAKAVAADPSSASRWLPQLQSAGVLAPGTDLSTMDPAALQTAAANLAKSTDTELAAYLAANPAMAEIDARHQAALAEISARIKGESGLASQNNAYTLAQIEARGKQERATAEAGMPAKDRAAATKMRTEYEGRDAVKNYRAVLPVINSARNAPDNGYGDLDLIYAVGKILDPNSVVREGELKLTIDASSPVAKLVGATRFNFEQGGRITPQKRQQLIGMLNNRVGALEKSYQYERNRYIGYAREGNIDPNMVVGGDPAAAYDQPARDNGVPDYNSLPSGATYTAPDGTTRRKR